MYGNVYLFVWVYSCRCHAQERIGVTCWCRAHCHPLVIGLAVQVPTLWARSPEGRCGATTVAMPMVIGIAVPAHALLFSRAGLLQGPDQNDRAEHAGIIQLATKRVSANHHVITPRGTLQGKIRNLRIIVFSLKFGLCKHFACFCGLYCRFQNHITSLGNGSPRTAQTKTDMHASNISNASYAEHVYTNIIVRQH